MIVVTGGAGFIGSCMVWQLNEAGIDDIVVLDDLGTGDKWKNLRKRRILDVVSIPDSLAWVEEHADEIDFIFHIGACSTTTEQDADYLMRNNVHYSMRIFALCTTHAIPLVYASSAATYGAGEHGYDDNLENVPKLLPINKYGYSKQLFDEWVLHQKKTPPMWVGLKYFNVYGPQEYHKGGQASVIYHAYPQIKDKGVLKLFKSYREGYEHGEQKRDFVYVKDVTKVMQHFYTKPKKERSGIYNLGTGSARTFLDLGRAVFSALGQEAKFDWIDMPDTLQQQYQYFTEASLDRLRTKAGYKEPFTSLEAGARDYVVGYLMREDTFL